MYKTCGMGRNKNVGYISKEVDELLVLVLLSLGQRLFLVCEGNKQTNKAELNVTAWQVGTHSENKPKTYKLANSLIKRLP